MSKINLLPWREELKKLKNQVFYAMLTVSIGACILLTMMINGYLNYRVAVENANIDYVNKELKNAKTEVSEVQALKRNKIQLLDRMSIIQSLQADRPSAVKLLDMLPRVLPEGLYLTELTRKESIPDSGAVAVSDKDKSPNAATKKSGIAGKKYIVTILGVALTNGSISVFLKKLEAIKWVSGVKLSEVSINKDGDGLNFNLGFIQNLEDRE